MPEPRRELVAAQCARRVLVHAPKHVPAVTRLFHLHNIGTTSYEAQCSNEQVSRGMPSLLTTVHDMQVMTHAKTLS